MGHENKMVCPVGTIERGTVLAVTDEGYQVASLDRVGIETPPIKALDKAVYAVGDAVIFLFFKDGTGKILCAM